MQRYHVASCTSAVNNSSIGGASARDSTRSVDNKSMASNFSINPRRLPPPILYKLKCDKEPLNSRLGPPDFHPQTPNCPEETLTEEYVVSGYKEAFVEGLEDSREISHTQVQNFTSPVVKKCKEAIKKCLRAINESRAQKRKAGQVYGVPLSGSLLTKPGVFPEQGPCDEDFKKKWIEGLSQPHKRLRSLADHVPHGYKKKSLLEVLIRNNVPLLRATWFIKVTYLNQVRPSSTSISSGTSDKTQLSRTELWTKDVVDYLQSLLDEYLSRNNPHSAPHSRDRSQKMLYTGSVQHRSDPASAVIDGEEPSLHFKWWYMARLLHWHHAEGLLLPSVIIDWVLSQLQEKDLLEILQLLLPIIYGVLETVVLSQSYVRTLVGIAVHFIHEPFPGGSDLEDNSRRAYTTSALIEMLRYLILAVPDTFVTLDCFPLPPIVVSYAVNEGAFVSKVSEDARKTTDNSAEVAGAFRSKGLDAQYQSLSFGRVVSFIQKRADNLVKAASSGYPVHSVAKAVRALDKALSLGDIREVYSYLFEKKCEGAVDGGWIEEVNPCLRLSLKWLRGVSLSLVHSLFLLCEWATCDYRDFRSAPPRELKFTGRKDFSQVYIVSRLLKLKIQDLQRPSGWKNEKSPPVSSLAKGSNEPNYFGSLPMGKGHGIKSDSKTVNRKGTDTSDIFESPGPLHDIIVCWIDQHEVYNGEGLKRLQLLIVELIRSGIFSPQAYVRQLIISGITDTSSPAPDLRRRKRHYRVLKQLPGPFVHDILEEARVAEGSELLEAMRIYSNERRLLLRGLLCEQYQNSVKSNTSVKTPRHHPPFAGKDGASPSSFEQQKNIHPQPSLKVKTEVDIENLKDSISALLQLPTCSTSSETGQDESQGSVKRPAESIGSKMAIVETPGCEDCRKAKRQKLSEERNSCLQGQSPSSDDEDTWWVRRGAKSSDSSKVDQPPKSSKQVSKGRQKVVRKTQSLAHLAAARIEGSQGASTSHVCDNKVSCPHHRTGIEGDNLKAMDGIGTMRGGDIVAIGKSLKQLRPVEMRTITVWLITVVRELVEETEKNGANASQFNRSFVNVDDRTSIRWKLGEDELSAILYLMDICSDLVSTAKLLLWLLPKVLSNPNSTIQSGRSIIIPQRNVENHACEVGEAFLLSSLRRYENIIIATDLIPEVLSATMRRVAALLASNERISGSAALIYSRHLLKKYGNMPSVLEWEKSFKATCDKRLFSELESGRSLDAEFGYPPGVPAGVDLDDFFRQKISGSRLSRVGMSMRDVVQRNIEDAFHYFGKERKLLGAGTAKSPGMEKSDDAYQIAQQIIMGLMECMRQTGGAAQEGDPSLVSSAVSAIVNNVGPTIAKMPDFSIGSNYSNASAATGSLNLARRILRIHLNCLCLLKEALGERQSRVFEVALATEASSALATAFSPGKASRSPFQISPESHDSSGNISNEILNNSAKATGRGTKSVAAISALLVGAIIHGVTTLERMVTVFRLKEGLDVIQFIKSMKSNSNGNARSLVVFKMDNSIEVYVHWFRLLVGNCRTVADGLIVELLGEPSIVALSRMQRLLPLSLVFPPAYSIFAFVIWRPFIATREDIHQLNASLTMAIGDAIKHLPFRDVCLRDSQGLYDLIAEDSVDAGFAAMLELTNLDARFKSKAFVPLRGRLFLNAIIDCKLPLSVITQDDGNRVSGHGGSKVQHAENETKLLDKLVNVLDALQPAKFHWQWVELRLLLNEQALIEKLEAHDMSLVDAIRSSSPDPEKAAASENENNFIEIILTRLLVRPDAAPLFSELVHLFGMSLEDSMLLQVKWFLGGHDVLFGRKTIRQRLINIAESKGLSTKAHFWKPWGWSSNGFDPVMDRGDKKKFEVPSLEEGEVVEEGLETKRSGKGSLTLFEHEGSSLFQQNVTERALVELVLPCIDQGSDDSRNTFAMDLIKQLSNIEQQINPVAHGTSKQTGTSSSGVEGPANKSSNRKGIRGGSPGLVRRVTATADSTLPSPAALRASMLLRLQLLLRLLPTICTNGEPSGRNMRHTLASVILRLLGSRVVHEDAELSFYPLQSFQSKRELELPLETASADLSGGSLFDWLLLVLHVLLSSSRPSWLKSRSASSTKMVNETKDFAGLDRELESLLNLQPTKLNKNDLDRMQLPGMIQLRIQSAMPILLPSVRCYVSCQPPPVPTAAVVSLQPSIAISGFHNGSNALKNPAPLARPANHISTKSKPLPVLLPLQQDGDMEIDPWTLLEDGTGSGPSSSNISVTGSVDRTNLRASSWLKGAVRVRRTDLTYIGAVDDDN
ncbi:MEDIATOR OF RNA polymerase II TRANSCRIPTION SUBUNIT 12 [Salix koriyanagi]|uniref:MEDIATOR OF RNA polymerase II TRANSCRIPTION SUBUNIT 12 n=1 Tax=Salix koriyanagi TaxID=2511006 RepID=A0A9Q0U3Z5_9ROSI|nr:MEDIATOR OF RNA polymerase II TRANSCRIPTION SUBUNIT 12 [Salix koriyanagi]KAJ6722947.1 MEDIATOR OF RNA polymerase II TRANSCRIPTION SUBUNIT 12 [Salix koriyanagi]